MSDGGFGWSEGISALSLGVSLFALAWAKTSADAAKRANLIQIHNYQKDLFIDFTNLYNSYRIRGLEIREDEIDVFNKHSATCHLYVTSALADDLIEFSNTCHLARENRQSRTSTREVIRIQSRLFFEETDPTIVALKEELAELDEVALKLRHRLDELGETTFKKLRSEVSLAPNKKGTFQILLEAYRQPFSWGDEEEPQ
ncbi:hypothetical protein [Pseudomonas oryzihabitans]|uniref:hypothetical protein n=1 Tax=Pseudomonas oryzihabitans TaxID=47885 RepID=UPI000AA8AA95|nr:hypothetical protein [Pseudomonas psychrotolerans]